MKFKNFILAIASVVMMGSAIQSNAQSTSDMTYRGVGYYDVLDSSYISKRNTQQQTDFLNYDYSHPARPKNQWEIGIKFGLFNIAGADVPYVYYPWHGQGIPGNIGVSVRKALGYSFSWRAEYDYAVAKGIGWLLSDAYTDVNSTSQWTNTLHDKDYNGDQVAPNYKTIFNAFYLDIIYNLGNISFHKSNPRWNWNLFAGLGAGNFDVLVDAEDGSSNKYDFEQILGSEYDKQNYDNRKNVIAALQGGMDGTYETSALNNQGKKGYNVQNTKPLASGGMGFQYLITKRISIGLEDRITFWNSDILDGQANHDDYRFSKTNDFTNALDITLGINLGKESNRVLPLWWVNPTDYLYSELTDPRHLRTEIDYTDTDGDGVLDPLDQEPNTPAGCPVNAHGVSLDTDGDGVPDCRDKQLITPTYCFPVDADGVGDCPCPDNCAPAAGCNISPTMLTFAGTSSLSPRNMSALDALYGVLVSNPDCRVVILGNGDKNKYEIQRSWDRVNKIINYLTDKGISRDRFIFQYSGSGDPSTVSIRAAGPNESGISNEKAPFPHLMNK